MYNLLRSINSAWFKCFAGAWNSIMPVVRRGEVILYSSVAKQ